MKEMTDEEAEYLDDLWTRTTPEIDPDKPGYFARKGLVLGYLEPDVIEYLRAEAAATGQTQAQVASTIIREKIAQSA
jgi:hypothetical protein